MKIIIVGTCLGVGGAEKVIVDLADEYAIRGHDVRIVSLTGPNSLKPKNSNVTLACLHMTSFLDILPAMWRLRREIAYFDADVVHAHLFHAILMTRLLKIVARLPMLVTTVHSKRVGGAFRRLAYRYTAYLSDVSTCVSQEVASEFFNSRASGSWPLRVMYNGISVEQFKRLETARREVYEEFGLDRGSRLVVSVGRLEPAKDYPNLLSAVALLKKNGERLFVFVVGEGTLRKELEEQIVRLGLANHVRLLGVRRDVCRLLSAADVFVLSSAWEGLPMCVGEAMACECAVVATDCGGVRELVGDTGFLVPAKNSLLLAESISQALHLSHEQRRHFGRKARDRIKTNFSLDASVTQWLEIYGHRS